MDSIILKGLQFYGYHGYFEEEAKLGQRFTVDLKLGLELESAAVSDDLARGVSYADVYPLVKESVEQKRFALIETLAMDIIKVLFERFELLKHVSICVKKTEVAIPGMLDYVGVELERVRPTQKNRERLSQQPKKLNVTTLSN